LILLKFFILGVLSALLFPPFFMMPLGLVIFSYLIKLLNQISIKQNLFYYFSLGFFYGLGFLLVFLFWIQNPFLMNEATKNFSIIGLILPVFLSIFIGLGFTIYKYFNKIYLLIIFTPFIFLLIELVIANILYGFPWITYSFILSNNLVGFYFLKYFGTYISSYLIIFIYIFPLLFIYSCKFKNIKKFISIIHLPFLVVFALLFFNLISNKVKQNQEISLEIFQIFSPINKFDKNSIQIDIINKIKNSNAEYVLFAENNYPYLISDINSIDILKHINDNKKVIIGTIRIDKNKFYNSFLFLEKDNIQIFDKQILVPFGEFLPFRSYLKFLENISGNVDFTPGNKERIIKSNDQVNILPVICYEVIFNKILRKINEKEIDILINITNDSWFGNTLGPYQHFYHARMRALISNKYLLRVSNNGISAIIDNNGKILNFTNLNTKQSFKYLLEIKNTIYFGAIHNIFIFYLIFIIFINFIFFRYNYKYDK
jgi:apolipoprotein N-acyltransferase